LLNDKDGSMWLRQVGSMISVLDLAKKNIQIIDKAAFPNAIIFGLSQDNKGRIWIRSLNNGLTIIDPEKRMVRHIRELNGLDLNYVVSIVHDSQGQTWAGTVAGLNMIDDNTTTIRHIGNQATSTLTEDSYGNIWQGTNFGANIIDRNHNVSRRLDSRSGIVNDTIETIRDIGGKILICTNSGLDIIDSSNRTITHLNKKNGLNGNATNAVTIDNQGRTWIGETRDGLDIYDPKSGKVTHFGKDDGLGGKNVDDLVKDSDGNIWVSLRNGGIAEIDPVAYTIRFLDGNPALNDNAIGKVLLAGHNGNMWVGTDKGIYIADQKNKTLTAVSTAQGLI